jgi:hypothetical protein
MRKLGLTVSVLFLFAVSLQAGKSPTDYPLQVQVIESHWHWHRYRSQVSDYVDGWGRGDIRDGDSVRGFDFSYTSPEPFHRTIGDAHYLAKWKRESLKMEMLVGEIGAPDKYHTYDLKTSVREDVYVPGPDGAVAVSQQEYKDKWAK